MPAEQDSNNIVPVAPRTPDSDKFYIDTTPQIIDIPKFSRKEDVNLRYPLLPPYAYANIYWDAQNNELIYYVEEPILTDTEKEILNLVKTGLEEMLNVSFVRAAKSNLILDYLEKNIRSILTELGTKLSKESYNKIIYYVYRDSVGLNEIEPLLKDYYIEDIECNGTNFPLYIVHRKFENMRTNVIFKESQRLTDFVEKLAQKSGRYVSYAKPLLDGTLPDGSRVNATYTDDVTTRGPTFTIRKFTTDPWTPIHLINFGTADPFMFAYLWLAIEHKFNIVVIGETSSGKTTFLNSIANFIPPEARICSIEDTRELNLAHINWLPAVTREGFGIPNLAGQSYGEITLFDLLKETFRQNPDYVIVGELRGEETYVLFQGMASGHPSFGTFHAGSVQTLIKRLETPPINLSPSLVETLDIVVIVTHIKMQDKAMRRVKEIDEILKVTEQLGKVDFNKLFAWNPINDSFEYNQQSAVLDRIVARTGLSINDLMSELQTRAALLSKLAQSNITDFKEVSQIFNTYYKNKQAILTQYGLQ
ncbi:type II/IV secretion system ATPase subunit [Candidatus Woesearchaeota archaeon]|nr:type II/IV secretion system ATPase subunit [Candidatus Woesearchaeota archaeon]